MQTILNLSGVRVHVGFTRQHDGWKWGQWEVDYAYSVDKDDSFIDEIDDIDTLGIMKNGVFHSVRTLAEEWIDGQSAAIELADRRSVVEERE